MAYQARIDPSRRPATRPDGTPDDNDRIEIGPTALAFEEWAARGIAPPDIEALRAYRLRRVREQLQARDYGGLLLWIPINIRYATDCSNMQIWTTRDFLRCAFIATDGPVILYDLPSCTHVSAHLTRVDERRPLTAFYYWEVGNRAPEFAAAFAAEIDALLRAHAGQNRRLAVDKMELDGIRAFDRLGVELRNGQEVMEHARAIKDANELNAIRCAVATTEIAMWAMQVALRPGMTESDLWSVLHAESIRRGGEWIETRLLSSGPRTNPWFQECGPRVIQDGDLVAFDTDLVGPYGYCADISRTWICGEARPSNAQRHLYQVAREKIVRNTEILGPGMEFREVAEKGFRLPDEFAAQRYSGTHHGVGLCDEYPLILYHTDFSETGYDGVLQPGMVLSVEAYVGTEGGREGVKLEEMVAITDRGVAPLSHYPFERVLC